MSLKTRILFCLMCPIAFFSLFGCEDSHPNKTERRFSQHNMMRAANDLEMPSEIWRQMVAIWKDERNIPQTIEESQGSKKKEEPKSESSSEEGEKKSPEENRDGGGYFDSRGGMAESGIPIEFKPFTVRLVEKNDGVLKNGDSELSFGPGGGELDLSEFVENKNGSFYFSVNYLPELKGIRKRVLFWSRSLLRKRGRDQLGSGCHVFYELTSAFNKLGWNEGFLLNTADGAHVSALAGTFFFLAVHERQMLISQLTVGDSKGNEFICAEGKKH